MSTRLEAEERYLEELEKRVAQQRQIVASLRSEQTCRCDGAPMQGSDHCPSCGCEEYEETCPR